MEAVGMKRKFKSGFTAALVAFVFSTFAGGIARAASDMAPAQQKRQLFRRGAQLWPVYCNTCHNPRPGGEFSPTEWNMILMHMRTQANLPPQDANAILEYLKASR
jgi:mono/diheme cytochrome c family protein